MRQVQKNWFGTAAGLRMDPDKAYGLQCVDVVDHYAEAIFPGVPWTRSVGGVSGAKDLLAVANREYWDIIYNDPKNSALLPQVGDVIVWGGSPTNQWGHTAVAAGNINQNGADVIQQNSNGLANQAAHLIRMGWYQGGTGMVTGWLRPKANKMLGDPAPAANGVKLLTVTASPAIVRTSPRVEPGNVARAYPNGIAKGAKVAAIGYVKGQDPYPNDGVQDDAWIKTTSGYFIWANGLGNDLSGLARV